MRIYFEAYNKTNTSYEVKNFWLTQWRKNFKTLTNTDLDEKIFNEYDYHYVLRFENQIGCIMSSATQNNNMNFNHDKYYSSLKNPNEFIQKYKFKNFHKMGMIAADPNVITPKFKFTRVLVGCGLLYVKTFIHECEAVVSFPRTDTSVYPSCTEWGAITEVTNLTMHNVPVNFIVLPISHIKNQHENPEIDQQTKSIWNQYYRSAFKHEAA